MVYTKLYTWQKEGWTQADDPCLRKIEVSDICLRLNALVNKELIHIAQLMLAVPSSRL